jgi:hypothetical protein
MVARVVRLSLGLVGLLGIFAIPAAGKSVDGDPAVIARMQQINQQLASRGVHVSLEQVEFFTIGSGRPVNKIHAEPFRWVASDSRRNADGDNITYLVDQSDGNTASGLTNAQTEAAIDRAINTWRTDQSMAKVPVVKRVDTGVDPDIVDSFFGFGTFGTIFLADIVEAGWLPRGFFDAIGGPGGGDNIIAVSFSFIFVNDDGSPTDINGDNRLDTALNEVYYNDAFGAHGSRSGFPWGIDVNLPGIDAETVALHENGHSLGIGHFGPPPDAVMNPVYAGIRHTLFLPDQSGMAAVWRSWPK